jgi:hypothetical protein
MWRVAGNICRVTHECDKSFTKKFDPKKHIHTYLVGSEVEAVLQRVDDADLASLGREFDTTTATHQKEPPKGVNKK